MTNLFKKTISTLVLLITSGISWAQGGYNTINSIRIWIPKTPVSDVKQLTTVNSNTSVSYIDGLGRSMQDMSVGASPLGKDIVTPVAHDALGRQPKTYLPYAASGGDPGSYRTDALNEQYQFYQQTQVSIPQISNPYTQIVYEASPLSRVLEQGAPGSSWAIGSGHTVKTDHEINDANEVRIWNVYGQGQAAAGSASIGANGSGYYASGTLYRTVLWDEDGSRVIEYTDKEGRKVCRKVQDGGNQISPTFMMTYYVYDDLDNLVYVIPPGLADNLSSFTEADAGFNNYIYAYHYDARRRAIEKKIPGRTGWEYLVYNAANQVVLSQNPEQAARSGGAVWSFIKYDALGRSVLSGEAANTATRDVLQSNVDAQALTGIFESRNNALPWGYTNNALPNTNLKIFSATYYDDYGILTTALNPSSGYFNQPVSGESNDNTGRTTVTVTNILGTNNYLMTSNYYDDKGRLVRGVKQHQLNGVDIVTNTYNFTGEVVTTVRSHYKDNALALTVSNSFQYDHAGRRISNTEQINQQAAQTYTYAYNELGQAESKGIGNQTISLAYNARGWMTKINAALFSMDLKYDDASQNPRYNGNIAQLLWKTGGNPTQHSYTYAYDRANRLLSGQSDEGYNEKDISYDKMGNIQALVREATTVTSGIGSISYNYGSGGNRLQGVSGNYARTYTYNSNGSVTSDGQVNIQYNELDLPRQVTGTTNVAYEYDASGSKLKKTTTAETRYYIGEIEYITNSTTPNPAIDIVHTEDGIARNNSGTFGYEYFLKDHLGNTRIVYNASGTVLQQTDYYPFGMVAKQAVNSAPNRYLYNGKEQQPELGGTQAGQLDYGARFYDPVIARWQVVDPASEQMRRHSPYNYAFNNPLRFTDPDGMTPSPYLSQGQIMSAAWSASGIHGSSWGMGFYMDQGAIADGYQALMNTVQFALQTAILATLNGGMSGTSRGGLSAARQSAAYAEARGAFAARAAAVEAEATANFAGSRGAGLNGIQQTYKVEVTGIAGTTRTANGSVLGNTNSISQSGMLADQIQIQGAKSTYIPETPLVQHSIIGTRTTLPLPDPEALGYSHTTLGGKISSKTGMFYRQSATFAETSWPLSEGNVVPNSRVDWYHHGRPFDHYVPHQHPFYWNGYNWMQEKGPGYPYFWEK